MVWSIDYQDDFQIVELRFSGETSGTELKKAAAARIEFGREKAASRFLINAADLVAQRSEILDVLDIPTKLYAEKGMDRSSKIAVVQPADPESQWISEFYENASVMRGWTVDVFADRAAAVAWLQSFDR